MPARCEGNCDHQEYSDPVVAAQALFNFSEVTPGYYDSSTNEFYSDVLKTKRIQKLKNVIYFDVTGGANTLYVYDKNNDAFIQVSGGGGGGSAILVGTIDQTTAHFPTVRPDGTPIIVGDYVKVSPSATVPFTLDGITFTSTRDQAVWAGTEWLLNANPFQKTNETPVNNASQESIAGLSNYQSQVNAEVKEEFEKVIYQEDVDDNTINLDANDKLQLKPKTANDKDKVWKVKADGTWDLTNIKEWKSVNTFAGEDGNDYILYILTENVTVSGVDYKKGFYTWNSVDGFVLRSSAVEVDDITIDKDANGKLEIKLDGVETKHIKSSALAKSTDNVRDYSTSVDTKLTTEKFVQKVLQNIATPQNNTDAANKKYVDDEIQKVIESTFTFVGFITTTEPSDNLKSGMLWLNANELPTTFPVNVKTYDGEDWSTATTEYTPKQFDTWSFGDNGYYWFGNEWNVIDTSASQTDDITLEKNASGELQFKKKTTADEDKAWQVNNSGEWDLKTLGEVQIVDNLNNAHKHSNWLYYVPADYESHDNFFTITAKQATTVSVAKYSGSSTYDELDLYTSPDKSTWTAWDGSAKTLANGDKLYIWNKKDHFSYHNGSSNNAIFRFTITGKVDLSGPLNSLLNFGEITHYGEFQQAFTNCNIESAKDLELPSTTSDYCYGRFFERCTMLTTPPTVFPAMTLSNRCYENVFSGCSNLATTPELPAETLASKCYYGMFYNCSNITSAEHYGTTIDAQSCYGMFYGCSKLATIKIHYTGNFDNNWASWVNGVATSGTRIFYYNGTDTTRGDNAIPNGWTVESF